MSTAESNRYKVKAPSRGGARPGAGRPRGSSSKLTLEDLLEQVEHHIGRTFAEQVAISYASAINRADHAGVRDYEKILLGKLVADRSEVTTISDESAAETKALVFQEALAKLALLNDKAK